MADDFDIPLTYKGKEFAFTACLITTGYGYKIVVDVLGKKVSYERDDENKFRAVLSHADMDKHENMDKALIKELAERLEEIFTD